MPMEVEHFVSVLQLFFHNVHETHRGVYTHDYVLFVHVQSHVAKIHHKDHKNISSPLFISACEKWWRAVSAFVKKSREKESLTEREYVL